MKKSQSNLVISGAVFLFLNLLLAQAPAQAERDVVVRPAPKNPTATSREVQVRPAAPAAKAPEKPLVPQPPAVPVVKLQPKIQPQVQPKVEPVVITPPAETSPKPLSSEKPKSFFQDLIDRWFSGKS
jgi:hypothetical protein